MINYASCFMIGKAHGWGTFPKWRVKLLILGPFLILRVPPILGLYPTHTTYSCHGIQEFKISTYPNPMHPSTQENVSHNLVNNLPGVAKLVWFCLGDCIVVGTIDQVFSHPTCMCENISSLTQISFIHCPLAHKMEENITIWLISFYVFIY
jgi:hypothetical protein